MKIADLNAPRMAAAGLRGLIMNCEERVAKNDNVFLTGFIADKEDSMSFKIWDNVPILKNLIVPGKAVEILQGSTEEYKNIISIKIASVKVLEDSEVDNYIPTSYASAEYIDKALFKDLVEEIRAYNLDIQPILDALKKLGLMNQFLTAPAGISMHHAYRRGLVTHCLEVVNTARSVASSYADPDVKIDMGILLTAALFHDVGKLLEYTTNELGLFTGFSVNGHLQGHSFIGAAMLNSILHKKVDKDRLTVLTHCLISHHGKPEWGAAVPPKTVEAMILHHCDMLSSGLVRYTEQGNTILES